MKLKSLFSPRIYKGDDEKTQQAIILNITGWSIAALIMLAEISNILGKNTPLAIHGFNGIFFVITLLYLYLLRRYKHINFLTGTFLTLGIIYLANALFNWGTVNTPATVGFLLPIMLAGFTFGKKGIYLTNIAISLIILILIIWENTGQITRVQQVPQITQWITYSAIFAFTSNIILVSMDILSRYWQKSQREVIRRKRAEETLELYSHAVTQNPASILITDAKGTIEQVNPKFLELTGYNEDEVIGKNPRILKSGHHTHDFYKDLWDTILAGKEWQGEIQNRKKNGEFYWEKASIAPIMNAQKEITHFVAIKQDITALREAQLKQKETNERLLEQLEENKALQEKLQQQALRDALTGLHNRHYMDEVLDQEFARAERTHEPLSIIVLDLDHLKELNDIGGHATGDHALRSLAEQMRASVRKGDTVCRYGGDEFAIIMPSTRPEDALTRAQELSKRMKVLTLLHRDDKVLKITFTAGIAAYPFHGETKEEIFNYADVALYRAKLQGRDRVELFSDEN